jgi:hypothetical protein
MKYYNEIYKYIKNNHPEDVSLMLQPHNMMKEIKNYLSKFNVWYVMCLYILLLIYVIGVWLWVKIISNQRIFFFSWAKSIIFRPF